MAFNLDITIPKPDDAAFIRGFDRMFRQLDKFEKKLKSVDRLTRRVGRGAGGGGGSGGGRGRGRGGPLLGSGASGRNPGPGLFGGGSSGGLANVARAAGFGGAIAVAAGAGAAAAGVVALVAAMRKAINVSAAFETSLVDIGRVANITGQDLKNFGDDVVELSLELPIATSRIFELASAGANAGLQGEKLASFTREMAKLATILPSLSEEQTRGIIRIASLTGFPVERISELNGSLLKLQQTTKATLPQLIKLSTRVAQDVGIFGASTEQVTALAATIADLGLQPERAATAIGRITGQLKQLDSIGPQALQKLTGTFRNQSRAAEFLDTALKDPVAAFQILGEESTDLRAALEALQITGKQNVIGQNVLKNIDRFTEILANAKVDESIVDEQALLKLKTFDSQLKLLSNTLEDGFKNLGDAVLGPLTTAIQKSLELGKGISDLVDDLATVSTFFVEGISFDELINELSGLNQATQVEEIIKGIGSEIKELQELGRANVLADDFRNLESTFKGIDDEIVNLGKDMRDAFREAGLGGKAIDEIMKDFRGTIIDLNLTPEFRSAREEFDRLVASIGRGKAEILDLSRSTDNINFKIEIFDLPEIEQQLRTISRSTGKEFQDLLGGEILNSLQSKNLQDQIQKLGLELQIDTSGDVNTLIARLAEVDPSDLFIGQQKGQLQEIQTIAERIATSQGVVEGLRGKRNAELDLLLKEQQKNLAADRRNIAGKTAPGLAAVTSAGAAVELVNQQKLTTDLQIEQLAELEKANDLAEEQIALAKRSRIKVATFAGGN